MLNKLFIFFEQLINKIIVILFSGKQGGCVTIPAISVAFYYIRWGTVLPKAIDNSLFPADGSNLEGIKAISAFFIFSYHFLSKFAIGIIGEDAIQNVTMAALASKL